jgi:hypothetical protein
MDKKKRNCLLVLFVLLASSVFANDYMFSIASGPAVGIALLGWLIVGAVWRAMNKDLVFLGPGAIIVILSSFALFFHVEFAIMFWLIYLGLLVVYFSFPHKSIALEKRRINLYFHGTTLAIVILGGAIGKYLYWSHHGGFAAWMEWMREIYPGFLVGFGFFSLLVFLWFHAKIVRNLKKADVQKKEVSNDVSKDV